MNIIFVRHGKDDERYRGGWSNINLTSEGVEQSKQLAKHLAQYKDLYKIQKIISSDLLRAMTTAKIISAELALPIYAEKDLREINNGDLAGMLNTEATEKHPGLYFKSLKINEPYPGGESPIEFYKRIKNWFERLLIKAKKESENILVVTHGGVINIIYHLVKNIEWSNQNPTYKSSNCGIHILEVESMKFIKENDSEFLNK